MEEQSRNCAQEGLLASVVEVGIFNVDSQALSEAIRSGELSREDAYSAHREFAKRTGHGLAKVVENVEIDANILENIEYEYLEDAISKDGLDRLLGQDRWDANHLASHGLLNISKAQAKYKDGLAIHDYANMFEVGLCGLNSVDNLLYGVQRDLFSHEDLNKREDIYLLTSARGAIYKYGMRGLSNEQTEVVDYCLREGLLTEKEAEKLDIAANVVNLSAYRRDNS